MTKPADDILFATINIPILDKAQAAQAILALDPGLSFWDDYRYTQMFPLMTRNGNAGAQGANNRREGDFAWTDYAPTVITEWFDNHVFPYIGMRARVMALVTQPGTANHEHIDCEPNELNTLQHKMRIVVQGKTDTLYWKTANGDVAAPDVDGAFVMDGGWPHGMVNTTNEVKVTLALGAPWFGCEHYPGMTVLQKRSEYVMPADLAPYYKIKPTQQ